MRGRKGDYPGAWACQTVSPCTGRTPMPCPCPANPPAPRGSGYLRGTGVQNTQGSRLEVSTLTSSERVSRRARDQGRSWHHLGEESRQSICLSPTQSCRHEDPPAVGGDHGLWCCVAHDCCYYRLQKRGCGTKLLNYKFSYRGGKIICAKQDSCRSELCQCDKTAASCFARNRKTYSKKYQYYNNKSCRGKTPRC
uniref:Phospholipase A2 n=1 Tax=Equus caballus TaxID=9796 RepID=A0A9L0S3T7_HORSE